MAAYVLGELPLEARPEFIGENQGVLVVIEPGTPAGFGRIREASYLKWGSPVNFSGGLFPQP